MITKINEMEIGYVAEITGYEKTAKNYLNKLLSMGLTKGTKIKLTKVAPLGDPVQIEVRGFSLSLRKVEANALIVREVK